MSQKYFLHTSIDWNKYFDHIFVVSRCKNFERREKIDKQFKDIGIIDYQYWYVGDYDFDNSKIFKENALLNNCASRASFGHYTLWKCCYELGYDNILVFEDDAIFDEDIDTTYSILELFNKDKKNIDIYLFDHYNIFEDEYFIKYVLCTCYYANKNGLEYLIRQHEKYNYISDMYFIKYKEQLLDRLNADNVLTYDWVMIDNKYNLMNFCLDKNDIIRLDVSPIKLCVQPDKCN